MLKFGKKTQYALVTLVHLGRIEPRARVTTRELSELYGIPEQHLGKVLQSLARNAILTSTPGSAGGYELARPLHEMRLGEILHAVNATVAKPARRVMPREMLACHVRGVTDEVQRRVENVVEDLRLEELLDNMPLAEPSEPAFDITSPSLERRAL